MERKGRNIADEYGLRIQNPDPKSNPSPLRIPERLILIAGLRSFLYERPINNPSGCNPTSYLIPLRSNPGIRDLHRDRHTLITGFGFGSVNPYSFGCTAAARRHARYRTYSTTQASSPNGQKTRTRSHTAKAASLQNPTHRPRRVRRS